MEVYNEIFNKKIFCHSVADPKNISFLNNLTIDSYAEHYTDYKFIIFRSINNILSLVYATKNNSIILYDIINNQKITEIKNANSSNITSFRYFLDKIKKIDYIISISSNDNSIKLWNIYNLECILNLNDIYKEGMLLSACFLNDNNQIYIITCNFCFFNSINLIKIFDFKGNKIKEIKDSEDNAFFIDNYYDNKSSINYIITGNEGYVKSYNYNENKLFFKYNNNSINKEFHSVKIDDSENITKLIASCGDGYIRIWNFHSGQILNIINCGIYLNCICLWNNEYAFVGCDNKIIKLVNLKSGIIIKDLVEHSNHVLDIKKINHPKYGECLISQGNKDDQIKLWVIPK